MNIYGFLSLIGAELVLGLIVFWAFIMAPELRALEKRIAGRIRYDVREIRRVARRMIGMTQQERR